MTEDQNKSTNGQSKPFKDQLLRLIGSQHYQPKGISALAADIGISENQYDTFAKVVRELAHDGSIVFTSSQAVALPPPGREMTGILRKHPNGFGFLVPDSPVMHGDLFIPPDGIGQAMTGDRVRAKVQHRPSRASSDRSPYIGRIIEIIQRGEHQYVGNLVKDGNRWYVQVDGKQSPAQIFVRDVGAKDANHGDKVVVEIINFGSDHKPPQGVIVEKLGESGRPDVETQAVIKAFGLPGPFTEAVLKEAREASANLDEEAIPDDRVDLTDLFITTIDPPDARDFDDAISITKLDPRSEGGAAYELGVHIADVSHFVRPGSALDAEAYERGNSCYLPRLVIPMLPEVLSNGVCSLQEGVNRFTKSVFIRFDEDAHVIDARFEQAVIRSNRRLTYLEAQALIERDLREARKHCKTEPRYPRELTDALQLMNELAIKIRERRMKQGMIVLGLPDAELVFDEAGNVIDAHPEDDAFTHTIIEMFMVEANEAAARLFDGMNIPMIRRIHPDPPSDDYSALRQFVRVAGFNIPASPTRHELQQLLEKVRGKPQQFAVHLAVLQTLSKAEYAPLTIGHFALASEHYTHFTSPIRRYPDLIVHRAIEAYLEARQSSKKKRDIRKNLQKDSRLPDAEALVQAGHHCSATERTAEAAERSLRQYLVLQFLVDFVGDDFEGTVTGITRDGLFVQLDRYLVDGFVHHSEIYIAGSERNEQWRLNQQTGALVAQRSGRSIQIGERLKVRIATIEPWARRMDLVALDSLSSPSKSKSSTANVKRRKQSKGAREAHRQTQNIKRNKKRSQRSQGPKNKGKGKGKRRR